MNLSVDFLAGVAGAAAAVWLGYPQLDALVRHFDLQALLFWSLHMQVALAFLLRRKVSARTQPFRGGCICGMSVFCVYLADLSQPASTLLDPPGKALTTLGCALAMLSLAALGRSFGILPTFRQLATTGPYRVVRHPVYASYLLMDLGILMSHPGLRNIAVIAFDITLLVMRLHMEEEACLESSPAYAGYASRVRFRLIPGIY